ncbi:MAG: hypothetical protein GX273_07560 [Bacteroidales bacterium]|nr:hypothetical protein [Bacteroidales bacterium]
MKLKILNKKSIIKTIIIAFAIGIHPISIFANIPTTYATKDNYIDYELGWRDLTVVPVTFITSYYPNQLEGKYIGWYTADSKASYDETWEGCNFSYIYINMLDVVNLFNDGKHEVTGPNKHKFTFGGNIVEFTEGSNTVTINGVSSYVGKIRYADSNKDMYRRGRYFGSKVTYNQSITTLGTSLPAEALDEVLQFGIIGDALPDKRLGDNAPYGIFVPDKYKKTNYTNDTYPTLIYSQMKAKLPDSVRSQIKEPSFNLSFIFDALKTKEYATNSQEFINGFNNEKNTILSSNDLLFGENYSNIDNYEQVAKVVKALFDMYPENAQDPMYYTFKDYRYLSEKELADKFRAIAKEGNCESIDFYDQYYKMDSNAYVRIYFNGKEKKNGISFAIKPLQFNDEAGTLVYRMLASVYPSELAETIVQKSMFEMSVKPNDKNMLGNDRLSKFNVVQASGNHKFFYGILPEDRRHDGQMIYVLLDNHPAMPGEQFLTANYELVAPLEDGSGSYSWGRGFREDFFTFSPLSSEVKKAIGMPEVYDCINYGQLVVTPQIRKQEGSTMPPLEKCTGNPYATYKKLR